MGYLATNNGNADSHSSRSQAPDSYSLSYTFVKLLLLESALQSVSFLVDAISAQNDVRARCFCDI
eukprot:scaffold479335_cov28-Prasinocladus_malaysianus.AAC.1